MNPTGASFDNACMDGTIAVAFPRMGVETHFVRRFALSAIVVGLLGPLAVANARSAFSETAPTSADGFAAGTVYVTTDADGHAILSLRNAAPGSTTTSDIVISYAGTLPATIRLYGDVGGTGLARFLTLTVTRGEGTGASFRPDASEYTGAGPGVVFHGTLAGLPSTFADGIVDPGTWQGSEGHTYRMTVTLTDDADAAGRTAEADLHWEARSL